MTSAGIGFRFDRAIVRTPARTVAQGIRSVDTGDPDADAFEQEHIRYVAALKRAGVQVTELSDLAAFPDSVFVEDPALCLPEGAIALRPGTASRQGEVDHIVPALKEAFDNVRFLGEPGYVDGGDILVTGREIVVGLSERTNQPGCQALQQILKMWGYSLRIVEPPKGVLHLKTACSALGDDLILSTKAMAASGLFRDYRVLQVPHGEEYAANVIRVNDHVLVPEGYDKTRQVIEDAGLAVLSVPTDQARKLDGGLSCMSLRFRAGQ